MNSAELWDFVEQARRATSMADLSAVTLRYSRAAGFNHYGFAIKFPKAVLGNAERYHQFNNFPEFWSRHRYTGLYASESAEEDPLIRHLRAGLPATAFSGKGMVTHTRPDIVRQANDLLRNARDQGINSGVVVPLAGLGASWGFMILTTTNSNDVRDALEALPNFHFFAHHVQCVSHLLLAKSRPRTGINRVEREILRWAAIGKTSWEIGRITNISERMINFHLQAAARKLGVAGRRAACARALVLGIIAL